jgi:hypothetical protein
MHSFKMIPAAAAIGALMVCPVTTSAQQATTPQAAAPARASAPVRTVPPSQNTTAPLPVQGFSVVLVLGDLQSGPASDNVPPAARKALADMKDFLPFKSYQLLDAEWVLGSSNVSTRLRGPEDHEYTLNMTAMPPRDGSKAIYISFQLREGDSVKATETSVVVEKRATDLAAERAAIEHQLEVLREQYGQNHPEVTRTRERLAAVEKELVEANRQGSTVVRGGRGSGSGVGAGFGLTTRTASIISTSFTMDLGETVVVGTSRLKGGDKALIALLTAVPRGRMGGKD